MAGALEMAVPDWVATPLVDVALPTEQLLALLPPLPLLELLELAGHENEGEGFEAVVVGGLLG